jgi:hypothetical protein
MCFVELLFVDRTLAAVCASRAQLAASYGDAVARVIGVRLHEIEAAMTLGELRLLPHMAIRVHETRSDVARVDVVRPVNILLRLLPRDEETITTAIDWDTPAPVMVLEISRAHG